MGKQKLNAGFAFLLFYILTFDIAVGEFIMGGEAERVCKAYKLICPSSKVCALQKLNMPRPMKFPVCLHEEMIPVKARICRKAPKPGKCGGRFVRWYFNVHMGACSWFTYSGCGGNRNNFRSAEDCERKCVTGKPGKGEKLIPIVEEEIVNKKFDSKLVNDLIPAPAKAAEDISITKEKLNDKTGNTIETTGKQAKVKSKKKRKRNHSKLKKDRKRKHHKDKLKKYLLTENRKKDPDVRFVKSTKRRLKPDRKLTPSELGPAYFKHRPRYAEMRNAKTSHLKLPRRKASENAWTRQGDQSLVSGSEWMIDKKFGRNTRDRRRRHRRRRRRPWYSRISRMGYPGNRQNTYYNKFKLFEVLREKNKDDDT